MFKYTKHGKFMEMQTHLRRVIVFVRSAKVFDVF